MAVGRDKLKRAKRWVVKIGSALLTNDGQGLDQQAISRWVDQIAALQSSGLEVVLVSSGSVAEGMTRLGWSERPSEIYNLQAAAAVGQMGLVQAYETNFQRHSMHTAQILLTHEDHSNRKRYLNAQATLRSLLGMGVVPVVNENDTVVTKEIRFGDNDTLGALVANLVEADALILLTDQDGLFTADPRHDNTATLISEARSEDESLSAMAGDGGKLGRGGMATKVRAAQLAARSGAVTVIASGREDDVLLRLRDAEALGTLLVPEKSPVVARKQWIAGHLQARGNLVLDEGAVRALRERGKSLLPAGVRSVSGDFSRGEMVIISDEFGRIVARGLVNYGVDAAGKIIGKSSHEIESILGFMGEEELVHRDNLVLA
ncbi:MULTISPECIES: glutamate 5-kinase [unclassified Neptuniibacter]|uniref:glutamate 5-kinase n=1 Tax=unclassified Neptuniibacter TaxID=2630693 RepID=UPI000C68AFB6|nr:MULTISPECIES: glutamate 5-kinase [unclassified Neptuniibacter]MAY42827.1 glutamate 5-kinase [Oceanospirillaceae bacterium]